jgi:hypothetical protein
MNLITPINEFNKMKSRSSVILRCKFCKKVFKSTKNQAQAVLAGSKNIKLDFCSRDCKSGYKSLVSRINFNCRECKKPSSSVPSIFYKSKNHFCSHRCSALFSNRNRKSGNTRSKPEIYLYSLLKEEFKNLEIISNERHLLPSKLEIDIYFPSLPLAIELNGPVHYINIWGKLKLIQSKDYKKQMELEELNIPLIIINISHIKSSKKCFEFLFNEFNTSLKPLIYSMINGVSPESRIQRD